MRRRRAVISDRRAEDDPWLWREMYRIRQRRDRSPDSRPQLQVKEEPVMDVLSPPRPDRKRKRPEGGTGDHLYEEDDDETKSL